MGNADACDGGEERRGEGRVKSKAREGGVLPAKHDWDRLGQKGAT